jgi:hypothetical protein
MDNKPGAASDAPGVEDWRRRERLYANAKQEL